MKLFCKLNILEISAIFTTLIMLSMFIPSNDIKVIFAEIISVIWLGIMLKKKGKSSMKKVKDIKGYVNVGDKVRYKGKIIEVMVFSTLDKKYSLQDTDQLYKKNKLFAEKIDGEWYLL